MRGALGSLYRGTDTVLGPVRRFLQGIPRAGSDESRLHALEQQNTALRKQLDDARLDRHAEAQLTRLRLSADARRLPRVPARVVATSASGGFDYTVTSRRHGERRARRARPSPTATDWSAACCTPTRPPLSSCSRSIPDRA